ncbi:glucuronate isomerase [Flavobacterium sp.]|uniref:glucuronate isomerase n=1 Tax=Flavobacterium sp. TaxID=239 RepID=UPI002488DA07|nr:glucuronate isomerase [Flavobacterium sp.]MDI1317045.1 glucuronate isomerase [Flavobacterium sp.]
MSKKTFLTDDFLLHNDEARQLFHHYAKTQPIIDYHCHLSPKDIAEDRQFENITQIWIYEDHYKWRAMRANGVEEKYITGNASDFEKFQKWAYTVPFTLRNPLYHWTHLELKNYFGITTLLNSETAEDIYIKTSSFLQQPEYSVKNLLRKMNVQMVGTTDDPTDDLRYHKQIQEQDFEILVLPTFRTDKSLNIENLVEFNNWITALENCCGSKIISFNDFIKSIQSRHDFFHGMGCRISDHGLSTFYAEDFNEDEIVLIFNKARKNIELTIPEINKFKSAMLFKLAIMDSEKSWVQQFHVGAIRNNNSKMMETIGPDKGFDSIGDENSSSQMSSFFDKLNVCSSLTKTIVYNLNPKDNEMFASMMANFNESPTTGKMQYGAAWWFLDQKDGIQKQLDVISNFGLLSNFIGMLTDSRSFMSFPRHEYFRRILCNILGKEMRNGELPNDLELVGNTVKNICYMNALIYFNLPIHEYKV